MPCDVSCSLDGGGKVAFFYLPIIIRKKKKRIYNTAVKVR